MTGFLNVDKRRGDTSAYVVNCVKRLVRPLLGKTPCGHLGTLDPLASGVLPVGIGNATRLFDYFLEKQKTYTARFRFGATTDTLDSEGEVVLGGRIPNREEVEAVLCRFTGRIEQIPPKFSARCIDGKRGYELARSGKEFELPSKSVEIFSIALKEQTAPDEFEFEITCSGGTYIRSLSRDIALALGTQGYTTGLRRTKSGIFSEKTAVSLDALTPENWREFLIPTDSVLPFPALEMNDDRYYQGVRFSVELADGRYKIYRAGEFYGTGIVEEGILRPEKKLC
ncbi:MAG: tRNA pseudouridine(55) synthase TruB [Clostridia bacterium]|nr:tRNA pseudouridine(55) synthase TruB [Clostridia bacterium]